GNQQAFELLCGISQDQSFLPAWDVFRSHRLVDSIFSVEAQDIDAQRTHVAERHGWTVGVLLLHLK
ncbi:MAG: hypothetical protein WBL84_01695, partial [Xanthobacteraceae bacterium]